MNSELLEQSTQASGQSTGLIEQYAAEGYRIVNFTSLYGYRAKLHSGEALYEGGYHEGSIDSIYGESSELSVQSSVKTEGGTTFVEHRLTNEPAYHAAITLSLVVYLYMLLRSWNFVRSTWDQWRGKLGERHLANEGGELHLTYFKQVTLLVGLLLIALTALHFADSIIPESSHIYEADGTWIALLGAMVLVGVMAAWCYAMHTLLTWLTRSDVMSELASVGYFSIVHATVILYPFTIAWLLATDTTSTIFGSVALLLASVELILYLKDTFFIFIEKNISILYWILYLCTAILLPMSFLMRILPEHLG